nr:immunoglobulin light chain junction region [Macaca mulatta]
CQLHYSYPFTF